MRREETHAHGVHEVSWCFTRVSEGLGVRWGIGEELWPLCRVLKSDSKKRWAVVPSVQYKGGFRLNRDSGYSEQVTVRSKFDLGDQSHLRGY